MKGYLDIQFSDTDSARALALSREGLVNVDKIFSFVAFVGHFVHHRNPA